ncbi:MAG TPA: SAM-dependent methyltransferase [Chromatiaceae bacterium]|jgi:predicted O-methyltransferase YrrM|nr:SAM-dependent methyltransferase [Chromatiaceae bacterium]HIN83142.1 SAM-dependent methyltransferase [Chromatiales bacterium]HIA08943.1 SAM-dependent methyltransferase [Chromatiaceae bacterium]HIB84667.1 SAM-dependent methyltransferase [Chromatiaceae bacterium]HIO14006.1 SAM-dependent methyltransferase [Chromatiales bacterium]
MSKRTLNIDEQVYDYILDNLAGREASVLRELRAETDRLPDHLMQIAPEQGQFMSLLVKLTGCQRAIEIGTYTGYSALSMALALPQQGRLICCDISQEWTAIAQRYWRQAGVDHKIDLRMAPALATLNELMADEIECFDLAFIDADKTNYLNYYECVLHLLRPGGVMLIDNTLWGGSVADADNHEPDTVAIRDFNQFVTNDRRVDYCLLPIADGLGMARKRDFSSDQ